VKLPFTLKLNAVTGVFARLNPMGLVAKFKGKKKSDDDDDALNTADEDDMFADLGDLDALDADAAARQAGEGEDEPVDYTSDDYTTDQEVDLDHMSSGGDAGGAPDADAADFADLNTDVPEGMGGEDDDGFDLSALEDMPDFDDNSEEDEEEATAEKKKKLLLIAGGGVAAAVLIGAASWLLMSGSDPATETAAKPIDLAAKHDAVVSLDNIPMAPQETPGAPAPAAAPTAPPADTGQEGHGMAPEAASQPSEINPQDRELAALGLNVSLEPGAGVVIPSGTKASYAHLAAAPPGTALPSAPIASVSEQSDLGILPKIAEDGTSPFEVYARPAPTLDAAKPKIALIVSGVGLSRAATEAAIHTMPQDVALALNVYARGLDFWVARAREDGHEVLLALPLETENFPFSDPGPDALRVLNSPEENMQKLQFILSRTSGYFGVLADQGGKFLGIDEQVTAVMAQLKARGLMYVDGGASGSLGTRVAYKLNAPWAAVEMNLDDAQSRAELDSQLQELADLAQKRSIAVGRVSATPMSLERLSAWIATLDQKGFQLVPISALAKKQLIR